MIEKPKLNEIKKNDFDIGFITASQWPVKNIIEKSGTWFSYSGERLGQGRENVKRLLKEKPELFVTIEGQVRKELGLLADSEPAPTNT